MQYHRTNLLEMLFGIFLGIAANHVDNNMTTVSTILLVTTS